LGPKERVSWPMFLRFDLLKKSNFTRDNEADLNGSVGGKADLKPKGLRFKSRIIIPLELEFFW
jgi:hypothetical protein